MMGRGARAWVVVGLVLILIGLPAAGGVLAMMAIGFGAVKAGTWVFSIMLALTFALILLGGARK